MDRILFNEYMAKVPSKLRMKGITKKKIYTKACYEKYCTKRNFEKGNFGLEMPHSIWF